MFVLGIPKNKSEILIALIFQRQYFLSMVNSISQSNNLLPSFSLIFETENLSSVELENIYKSLASLAEQSISVAKANEFLIIDGDYAPPEVIEELGLKYPWIIVKKFPGIRYYEAKMKGAELATGEIVIYCDSDCIYDKNWLSNILSKFAEKPDINAIAGETATPIRNSYELAIALHYFFPRFSQKTQPYLSNHYFLNNVAFRRDFLLQNPIPTQLPMYRSNCLLHAYYLTCLKGYEIWKDPEVRAIHEPPSLNFIAWRSLLRGRDRVWRDIIKSRLIENPDITKGSDLSAETHLNLLQKTSAIISTLFKTKIAKSWQIRSVIQEDIRHLVLFPLTIPYILWFEFLYFLGSAITYFEPNLILNLYEKSEEKVGSL
jgi:glycosyltransferase involved in cell wall biosynthesis